MYDLNFDKLINLLLPLRMQQAWFLKWLRGLIAPIVSLQQQFLKNRNTNIYKVNHNAQVFSLEKVLNDRFDPTERRIYITDGFTKNRVYIFDSNAQKPMFLGTQTLYNPGDYADTGVDFIVWTPSLSSLKPQDKIEIASLVNFYKLAGTRFSIY